MIEEPMDLDLRFSRFSWASLPRLLCGGGIQHVPTIFRWEVAYIPKRIFETHVLGYVLTGLGLTPKGAYATDNELDLLNEINVFHCLRMFGECFTRADTLLSLDLCEAMLDDKLEAMKFNGPRTRSSVNRF